MYNQLSRIDIFTVDPVGLQREKNKTKTKFGGMLTIFLCIIPIFAFVILFIINANKAPILTENVFYTKDLNDPIKAYVEFDRKYIDTEMTVFLIGTKEYTSQKCVKDGEKDFPQYIPLCNQAKDYKGEPNGFGFIFNLNLPRLPYYPLPYENSDTIIHFDMENRIVYLVQPLLDQFCLVNFFSATNVCYPYNSFVSKPKYYVFMIDSDQYVTVFDFIDTVYLFKNNVLNKTFTFTQQSTNKKYKGNFLYCNEFVLCSTNNNIAILENYEEIYYNVPKNTIYYKIYVSSNQLYGLQVELFGNITTLNITKVSLDKANFSSNFSSESLIYQYQFPGFDKAYTDNKYSIFQYSSYYFMAYTLESFYNDSIIIDNLPYNFTVKKIITYITVIDIPTFRMCQTEIQRDYVFDFSNKPFSKFKVNLNIENNIIVINDFYDYDSFIRQTKTYLVDSSCQVDSFDGDIIQYNQFTLNEVLKITKISSTDYYFYLSKSAFTIGSDFFPKTINTGPVLKCNFDTQINCKQIFTNGLSIVDPNKDFVDFDESLNENTIVGYLKINETKLPILISDLLVTQDTENNVNIQSLLLTKTNDVLSLNRKKKTLYNLKIKNKKQKTEPWFSNNLYYEIDNSQSGSDNKFDCITSLDMTIFKLDGLVDKTYPKNQVTCSINSQLFFPWIFDDSFYVRYSVAQKDYAFNTSDGVSGLLFVSLDDTFHTTTSTSTQDSIYTLIGSVGGFFSSLMTAFVFIKNKKYNHDNKDEINRRLTIENSEIDTEKNLYPEAFQDKVNLQLTIIRSEAL